MDKMTSGMELLAAAVKEGGSSRSGPIDTIGIGKPTVFSNDESKFAAWSKKLENFVSGGFDERARKLMTHAADLGKDPFKDEDAAIEFDERVMEILPKVHEQLYTILCGITEGEAFDIRHRERQLRWQGPRVLPETLPSLRSDD